MGTRVSVQVPRICHAILMAAHGGQQSRRLVLGRFERLGLYGLHVLVVGWFIADRRRGQVL
ncbi:hypothetical protein [Mycobacterium sp.]|uniref:hypothetical protein n=1 Tax=Mycobacterium sp. TaxID=1785 RepID=UPI003F9C1D8E